MKKRKQGRGRIEQFWFSSERDPRAGEERRAWAELAALNLQDEHWQEDVLAVVEKILVSFEWRLECLRKVIQIQNQSSE
jgi:hypothetical protein